MEISKMVRRKGEWMPNPKFVRALFEQDPKKNVVVVLHKGKKLLDFVFGENIVTTTGEVYYAQRACTESPTNNYTTLWLASNGPATPAKTDNRGNFTDIAASNKANSSGYPKSNDNDTDNTGAGGDGNTVNDIVIMDHSTFKLRAERQGGGDGRVYGISFRVTDGAGNTTEATCYAGVPHDQSGQAPVDSGPDHTVTP